MADGHGTRALGGGAAPRLAIGLVLATLASGCTSGPTAPSPAPEADQGATEAGQLAVPYEVEIQGVDDADLRKLLEEVSETKRLVERPPPSLIRLRQRAEADRPRLQQALRSRGYYDAEISVAIDSHAEPARVLARTIGAGMRDIALGLAIGLVGAFALTRILRGLLFGVGIADPVTLAAGTTILAFAGLLACWIPARRAARVDPMVALRQE